MSLAEVGKRLEELARGSVSYDRPLAPFTTYRLGGKTTILFEPVSPEDLRSLPAAIRDAGLPPEQVPVLVVGRGSNLVVSDQGFEGVAIRLASVFAWIEPGTSDISVRAGAATSLPLLANWAARRSLSGLEFTVGIPGSVGGGVRMNAGAHDGAIADTLAQVEIFDAVSGTSDARAANALELTYRHSRLTEKEVVIAAAFDLVPDEQAAIRGRMERYRRHRADTQPGALQNAGSTFKNPVGDSAGRLVDAAGLKGYRVGGASVSELHANFFVAGDGATAQDVFDLVQEVRARVAQRFGVELEPEVRFVGPFAVASEQASSR